MFSRGFASLVASLLLGSGVAATLGCGDETSAPLAPSTSLSTSNARRDASTADPTFLSPAAGAPTIANPVVSFWAKQDVDRRVRMYYHAAPGAVDSVTFLDFRVDAGSLATYPDGRPFAPGDSVLVTLSLVDPQRLIVDCQPAGLTFSASRPAKLKMSFANTNPDLNRDGTVNGADVTIQTTLRIWRRESAREPWVAQRSAVELGLSEVRTDVLGFSGYVIAY